MVVLRRPGALWIYALLILGTGLWSVWEVGLDWWALMPRGVVIVAIGLWLMTPWVTRDLNASGRQPWGLAAGPVAVMVVASKETPSGDIDPRYRSGGAQSGLAGMAQYRF